MTASNFITNHTEHKSTSRVLAERDRAKLKSSAIADDEIAARGYYTELDRDRLDALGFHGAQCRPGMVIPRFTTAGRPSGYILRPHDPRMDDKGKPIKYETARGSRSMIDCGPHTRAGLIDSAVVTYVTESIFKADALTSQGLLAVNVNGCYGFMRDHRPIDDLDDIAVAGKRFVIVFDSDIRTNSQVHNAARRLGRALERRGGKVDVAILPDRPGGDKCGVDDYFADGHTVTDLMATVKPLNALEAAIVPDDDDPQERRIAELETALKTANAEIARLRERRRLEREVLAARTAPLSERVAVLAVADELERVTLHGDGLLGLGGDRGAVQAVDETGGIFVSGGRMEEVTGLSPATMATARASLAAKGVVRNTVTRIRSGERVSKDGEIKPGFVSTSRVAPTVELASFLPTWLAATNAAPPKIRKQRTQINRCDLHPDADQIQRVTLECAICHKEIAQERVSRIEANPRAAFDYIINGDAEIKAAASEVWSADILNPKNNDSECTEPPVNYIVAPAAPTSLLSPKIAIQKIDRTSISLLGMGEPGNDRWTQ